MTGNGAAASTPVTGGKLGVPQRPQVNLLPAEVTHRRQKASAQRRMVWAIIATFVIIALAFGGAFLVRANAALNYEEAMATADTLTQQRRDYSPVIEVKDNIESTIVARSFVLANEVNWPSYAYALAAVLPDDVEFVSISTEAAGAGEGLVAGADELTTNAIGIITFEAKSPTLPVASEWIDAMEAVPGLADANVQSADLAEEDGDEFYDVAVTVQVTVDALQLREFSDLMTAEGAPAGEATDGGDAATDSEDGE